MKKTIIEKKRKISLTFSLLGAIFLMIGVSLLTYDYILEQKALNISATIKSIDYVSGQSKATVTYRLNMTNYENVIEINDDNELAVSDKIYIKVNMYNPNQIVKNDHQILAIIFLVISIIILIIYFSRYLKYNKEYKRIKKIKKNCYHIIADITEIIVDNQVKTKKGSYPSRVRAQYLNPQDQKVYIYESLNTYENLQSIIETHNKKTVSVYIDKNYTNNYYVDLDSLYPQIQLVNPYEIAKNKSNMN